VPRAWRDLALRGDAETIASTLSVSALGSARKGSRCVGYTGGFNKLFVSGRDFSFRQLPDNGRKGAIRSPESRNSRITHKVTAAAFRNIIISGAFQEPRRRRLRIND
jgi:hypothetical protein